MIYQIYDKKDLIVETDSIKFVKTVIRKHPGCMVKEIRTEKILKAS